MAGKQSFTEPTIKKLWGFSAQRCNMCKIELAQESIRGNTTFLIGEQAHIAGEKPTSARYDKDMTDKQRMAYENLILLCPTDHKKIDKNAVDYPTAVLHDLKEKHEKWVSDNLEADISEVTFEELADVLEHLESTDSSAYVLDDLTLLSVKEKISHNKLSPKVERQIRLGLTQCQQVKDFLNKYPDPQYARRFKANFIARYNQLLAKGVEPDEIFFEIIEWASGKRSDIRKQSAVVAVVTFLFEQCDIFEK
jgi:hypothetical protein